MPPSELGHDALLAPLTFISVFGYQAQLGYVQANDIAIADEKIVQVDQELKFLLPIKEGDKLYCDVYVHSIRQSFGADIIVTKNIVTNDKGEIVQETYTTLAGRSDEDGEVASTMALREFDSVKVGDQLPEKVIPLTRQDLVNYAGVSGDLNPIHWDDEIAKQVGLDTAIAHGMLTMGLGGGYVTSWVGDPAAVTEYNVRFTAVVPVPNDGVGAEIVFNGRVKSVDPETKSVTIALIGHIRRQEDLRPRRRDSEAGVDGWRSRQTSWGWSTTTPTTSSSAARRFASTPPRSSPTIRRTSTRRPPPNSATRRSSLRRPSLDPGADDAAATSSGRSTSASRPCRSCRSTRSSSIHKPMLAGDKLWGRMEVDIRQRAVRRGHRPVTRNVCPRRERRVVLEAFTTLMGHEGDNSISVKWDPESGQVVRTARRRIGDGAD